MSYSEYRHHGLRAGFSMIEIVIVLVFMAIIMRMAIPRINTGMYRADAGAQQVRSVFQTAQRTSLTRQFDVIVSVDTTKFELQIAEDANNDGTIQSSEVKFWRPSGEGNSFAIPPVGVNTASVTNAVIGSNLKSVNGLPSVIFHRDGSTNTDVEIYIQNTYKTRTDYRAVTVTRSTGRTDLYRLSGTGPTAKWLVVQ